MTEAIEKEVALHPEKETLTREWGEKFVKKLHKPVKAAKERTKDSR